MKIAFYVIGGLVLAISLLVLVFAGVNEEVHRQKGEMIAAAQSTETTVAPGFLIGTICVCTAAVIGAIEEAGKKK